MRRASCWAATVRHLHSERETRETRQSLSGSLRRVLGGKCDKRCPALPTRLVPRQFCGVLQELGEGHRLCRLCRGGAPDPRATTTNYTPAATALPSLKHKVMPWCPQARSSCRRGTNSRIKTRAASCPSPIFPGGAPDPRATTTKCPPIATALPSVEKKVRPWYPQARPSRL